MCDCRVRLLVRVSTLNETRRADSIGVVVETAEPVFLSWIARRWRLGGAGPDPEFVVVLSSCRLVVRFSRLFFRCPVLFLRVWPCPIRGGGSFSCLF